MNYTSDLDLPEKPTLFLEFHDGQASVYEQVEIVEAVAAEKGRRGV